MARYLRVAGNYDATSFLLLLHSEPSSRNFMNYNSDAFDDPFEKAWYTNDSEERSRRMYEAEAQALKERPMIPLHFYSGPRLVRPYVKGWIDNARGVYPSRWLSIQP